MYEKFLPEFHAVEVNNSTAHRIGHAISQVPAYTKAPTGLSLGTVAHVTINGYKFVENGIIVGLGTDGVLSNYDATKHSVPCLVYTDPLCTGPFDRMSDYAEEAVDEKPVYVRALPLYVGDTFTTDNYEGTAGDGYAKVAEGKLTIQSAADADTLFIAKKTTLPNRKVAIEFTYIGKPEVTA